MAGASDEGTAKFAASTKSGAVGDHFRIAEGLTLSSLGLGTYLGDADDATDAAYGSALVEAVKRGVNVIDTASNYRHQRSERVIGESLAELESEGFSRDQLVISTKGGYIPLDENPPPDLEAYKQARFFDRGVFAPEDVVSRSHVLTPSFLEDQLSQSLSNLGVSTIDIYYLHNPEAQLAAVDRAELAVRMRAAFEFLEQAVADERIAHYGVASWQAHRVEPTAPSYMSLVDVEGWAREVAFEDHHLRFVQAPYNLAMTEAFTVQNHEIDETPHSLLQAAEALEVHVIVSAGLAQGRLTSGMPDWLEKVFKGLSTDAQRCLQFARSTPGVTTALVGMKSVEHVVENLQLAAVEPTRIEDFLQLFEVDATE